MKYVLVFITVFLSFYSAMGFAAVEGDVVGSREDQIVAKVSDYDVCGNNNSDFSVDLLKKCRIIYLKATNMASQIINTKTLLANDEAWNFLMMYQIRPYTDKCSHHPANYCFPEEAVKDAQRLIPRLANRMVYIDALLSRVLNNMKSNELSEQDKKEIEARKATYQVNSEILKNLKQDLEEKITVRNSLAIIATILATIVGLIFFWEFFAVFYVTSSAVATGAFSSLMLKLTIASIIASVLSAGTGIKAYLVNKTVSSITQEVDKMTENNNKLSNQIYFDNKVTDIQNGEKERENTPSMPVMP